MMTTVYKDELGNVVNIGECKNPKEEWTKHEQFVTTMTDGSRIVAEDYKKTRKSLYPSVEDQLDDLYHNGISGWKETIKKIKDSNPVV
jgi:hypothetical protein